MWIKLSKIHKLIFYNKSSVFHTNFINSLSEEYAEINSDSIHSTLIYIGSEIIGGVCGM